MSPLMFAPDTGGAAGSEGGDEAGQVDGEPGGESHDDGESGEPGGESPAKYTDDDVDAIVSKRLDRERGKIEREIREKIAKEQEDDLTEAEKLRNMTELQRAQYEKEKLEEEKAALLAERDLNEQTAIARRELSEAGINLGDDLLSMFVSADAEETGKAIDQIKDIWPKAVNAAVQERLKSTPPPADKNHAAKSFGAAFAEQYTKDKNGGNE